MAAAQRPLLMLAVSVAVTVLGGCTPSPYPAAAAVTSASKVPAPPGSTVSAGAADPTGSATRRPTARPSGAGADPLGGPLSDELPGELTRVTLTWYSGDQYWEGPGPRPVTAGTDYALVLQCDGQSSDRRAVVGVSDRADPDGRTGADAFGVVACDGRVRELAYHPSTDGRVELRPASSPQGAKVIAIIRRLRPGEHLPDAVSTVGPPGQAGAPLPLPGAVRNELTRLTDGSGPGSAQVQRGLTYEVTAACTANGDLLTWELISSDQTDADGSKLSLASGTVPCDGRPRTERRTMAVTGQLTVHATAQPGDPGAASGPAGYWVTMSGPA